MPTSTNVDDRGFLRITLTGPWPTMDELTTLRAVVEGSTPGHRRVLADIRGVTEQFPYYSEIRAAIERIRGNKASAARLRAFVVHSDLQFGVARVFQSSLPDVIQVFRDEDAATSWLLETAAPPSEPQRFT